MKELKAENMDLKKIIETKDKKIIVLEERLKALDHKYHQDLGENNKKLVAQVRELEMKSDTIAYLTSQLHHAKLKQSGTKREGATTGRRKQDHSSDVDQDSSRVTAQPDAAQPHQVTPSPPREGTPSGTRRPFRRASSSPVAQELTSMTKPRSSRAVGIQAYPNEIQLNCKPAKSSKGMPSRPTRGSSPPRPRHGVGKSAQRSAGRDKLPAEEYLEFLKTGSRAEPHIVVRQAPEPLPPIPGSDQLTSGPYSGRVQVSRAHSSQEVSTAIYSVGADGEGTALVTDDVRKIIVSPLSSPEKGWRHKQRSPQQNGAD